MEQTEGQQHPNTALAGSVQSGAGIRIDVQPPARQSRTHRRSDGGHRPKPSGSRLRTWLVSGGMVGLFFLLVWLAVCLWVWLGIQNGQPGGGGTVYDYGMCIDAGSHGSRIHVYRWPERLYDPRFPLTGPVTFPEHMGAYKIKPGISSYTNDLDKLGSALQELLEYAQATLAAHKDRWSSFPLYLKATAGMRDLPIRDRDTIMNAIRTVFANTTSNPFLFRPDDARVISGEEEGVYGWLAVNHASDRLIQESCATVGCYGGTIGALDMGGASTQITFIPKHTSIMEDMFPVHLGSHYIRLFSHSFLGYGYADALHRATGKWAIRHITGAAPSLAIADGVAGADGGDGVGVWPSVLVKTKAKEISADHPCYPKGHRFKWVQATLHDPDYHIHSSEGPDAHNATDVRFTGTGDFNKCLLLTKQLFYSAPCFVGSCSFNGVYTPRILDTTFVAFGAYADLYKIMNLGAGATLMQWGHAADDLCSRSIPELQEQLPDLSQKDLSLLCWKATWNYAMLVQGYGFHRHTAQIHFQGISSSGDESIMPDDELPEASWATGSMIFEVNYYPWRVPGEQWQAPFWLCMAAAVFFAALSLILAIQVCNYRAAHGYSKIPYSLLNSHPQPSPLLLSSHHASAPPTPGHMHHHHHHVQPHAHHAGPTGLSAGDSFEGRSLPVVPANLPGTVTEGYRAL